MADIKLDFSNRHCEMLIHLHRLLSPKATEEFRYNVLVALSHTVSKLYGTLDSAPSVDMTVLSINNFNYYYHKALLNHEIDMLNDLYCDWLDGKSLDRTAYLKILFHVDAQIYKLLMSLGESDLTLFNRLKQSKKVATEVVKEIRKKDRATVEEAGRQKQIFITKLLKPKNTKQSKKLVFHIPNEKRNESGGDRLQRKLKKGKDI